MSATKVAIATVTSRGLHDQVSPVLGKAETFTIVTIEDDKVSDVKVLENPAATFDHGRGPVVVNLFVMKGINVVIASEFGPGISALLEQHQIKRMKVKPKTPVIDVVKEFAFSFPKQ